MKAASGGPSVGRRSLHGALGIVACIGVGLVLAACSSTNGSATSTTTTTTTRASTTTSTTSRGGSTTTSTTAGLATCQVSQLKVVPQQGTGAAGTINLTVNLTNTSTTTCELQGYPGMQLLSAQGQSLPTNVVRGQAQFPSTAANQTAALVTLAPGATATFSINYEDVPVGNETSCPTSAQAEITPPNNVTHAVVTLAIAPCNGGTVHVSPVYAAA